MKRSLTVDQAAEALYTIMGKDDKTRWLSQLSKVPELDLARAEDELWFLDCFAIYFSLKFIRSPCWTDKSVLVFEKLLGLIVSWLGHFWESKHAGTMEDAYETIDARLKAYGATIEEPNSAGPDEMLRSIGLTFAAFAFADSDSMEIDRRPRQDGFPVFLRKLSQDQEDIVITIAGSAFNYRIQSLYSFFDSYKLK